MKLRIKGNSIRLRLLRSEVERFAANGHVSDEVRFGPSSPGLKYSLVMSRDTEFITSRFERNEIVIEVPEGEARAWAASDQVGLRSDESTGDRTARVLVEKDFECLERPDDPDRDDAYPHPASVSCTGQA